MTELRFLIDDVGQSRSQRAVLASFARSLPAPAEVAWSSALAQPRRWDDAPAESARRLGLRLQALAPAPGRRTVFIPGHVVPGAVQAFTAEVPATDLPASTTVAALDLFVADNAHPLAAEYAAHCAAHPDYESCSGHPGAGFTCLPVWLTAGGLSSALLLTQRPWYAARVGSSRQWLEWLARAMQQGLLTLADVAADIREGLVRPSLLAEAQALAAGSAPTSAADTTLDAIFVCPERRVPDAQYAMLHSAALQERMLLHAKLKGARKAQAARGGRSASPLRTAYRTLRSAAKRVYSLGFRGLYLCYSVTLRPLIRRSPDRRPGPR